MQVKKKLTANTQEGFTLIELSIVLVIIGLIIGGILTGADLIDAAACRSQIAQIEHYNTAVSTFRNKYGYLPGDIANPYATQFGFPGGVGNGNGIVESGAYFDYPQWILGNYQAGEISLFWVDLSIANLIDGSFNTATGSGVYTASGSGLNAYFPQAKIGNGNYVAIDDGGYYGNDNLNYYTVQAITSMSNSLVTANPGMTVRQAYNIDKKADDGLPQSGNIIAAFNTSCGGSVCLNEIGTALYGVLNWAAAPTYSGDCGTGAGSCNNIDGPTTAATPGSSLTCYDNRGAGAQQYSTEQNGGGGTNCGLSFRFQ